MIQIVALRDCSIIQPVLQSYTCVARRPQGPYIILVGSVHLVETEGGAELRAARVSMPHCLFGAEGSRQTRTPCRTEREVDSTPSPAPTCSDRARAGCAVIDVYRSPTACRFWPAHPLFPRGHAEACLPPQLQHHRLEAGVQPTPCPVTRFFAQSPVRYYLHLLRGAYVRRSATLPAVCRHGAPGR